jgi:ABC-type transport system involved in multi-copper enzyme maturation permease subunit
MKNRIGGIFVPIVLQAISPMVMGLVGLSRFCLINSFKFERFVGVAGSVFPGDNFFINLAVYLVYMIALMVVSLVVFKKRDMA